MLVPNSEEICVNINECLGSPCVNGECIDRERGFDCNCFSGYSGTYCTAKEEAYTAYVSHGFIIAIIICALVILRECRRAPTRSSQEPTCFRHGHVHFRCCKAAFCSCLWWH